MSDKIKVKAKELVIEYDDGQTVVINAGETGLLTEGKANVLKDEGRVTFVTQKGGKGATPKPDAEPAQDEGNADAGDDASEGDVGADAGAPAGNAAP